MSGHWQHELGSYLPGYLRKWLAESGQSPTETTVHSSIGVLLFADIAGFTPLSVKLAQLGPQGAEELDRIVNDYVGSMVRLIHQRGGDIVAFAGDAALAFWSPPAGHSLGSSIVHATAAAHRLQRELDQYRAADDITLSMKITVAAGQLYHGTVGGYDSEWLPFAGGPVIEQIQACSDQVQPGQVLLTDQTHRLATAEGVINRANVISTPTSSGQILSAITESTQQAPLPLILPEAESSDALRPFVPPVVRARFDAGQAGWLSDLRFLTVAFIELSQQHVRSEEDVMRVHDATRVIQRAAASTHGELLHVLHDDKGVLLVLAYGLPPLVHHDFADQAVVAAMNVRRQLLAEGITTSIGIASGRVFSGPRGGPARRAYTITGRAVNLAARLMSIAEGEIFLDQTTHDILRAVVCNSLEARQVKGLPKPVQLFSPAAWNKSSYVERTEADADFFVAGREAERLELVAWLERPHADNASPLVISGVTGIGKSHLVGWLKRETRERGYAWRLGEANLLERATPYYAWRRILSRLLGLDASESVDEPIERLRECLSAEGCAHEFLPLLGDVLEIDLPPNDTTAQLEGRVRAEQLQQLVVQLFNTASRDQPIVAVIEDAQWLDGASWDLLTAVSKHCRRTAVAIVVRSSAGSAPQGLEQLLANERTDRLEVGPLTRQEVAAMAADRLRAERVSGPLADFLEERSGGNPLFVAELIEYLLQNEHLSTSADNVTLTRHLEASDIPSSIRRLLTARVDRLPLEEQLTLKTASVIGRRFAQRMLASVHQITEQRPQVPQQLEQIASTGLIRPAKGATEHDQAYLFSQAAIYDVIYEQFPYADRRVVHRAIAEWLEHHEGVSNHNLRLLAHHWGGAGERQREIDYLSQASEAAMQSFANRDAIETLQAALAKQQQLAPQPTEAQIRQRAHWQRLLGEANYRIGELAIACEHLRKSLALMRRAPPSNWRELAVRSTVEVSRQICHRCLPGVFLGREVVDSSEETRGGEYEAVMASYRLSQLHYLRGEMVEGFCRVIGTLNDAERLGVSTRLGFSYGAMCLLTDMLRQRWLGGVYARLAEPAARQVGNKQTLSHLLMTLAIHHLGDGDWLTSGRQLKESLELAQLQSHQINLYDALTVSGMRHCFLGEYDEARTFFEKIYPVAERTGSDMHRAVADSGIGECCLRQGDIEQAIERLQFADQLLRGKEYRSEQIRIGGLLALAYWRNGDREPAIDAAERGTEIARKTLFSTVSTLEGHACLAEVAILRWRLARDEAVAPNDARKLRQAASKACRRLQKYAAMYPIGKPRSLLMQGLYASAAGKSWQSARHFRRGLDRAERLKLPLEIAMAEAGAETKHGLLSSGYSPPAQNTKS